jgi:hypothetical protein
VLRVERSAYIRALTPRTGAPDGPPAPPAARTSCHALELTHYRTTSRRATVANEQ